MCVCAFIGVYECVIMDMCISSAPLLRVAAVRSCQSILVYLYMYVMSVSHVPLLRVVPVHSCQCILMYDYMRVYV